VPCDCVVHEVVFYHCVVGFARVFVVARVVVLAFGVFVL
jgi:hypothetical protein